MELVVLSAKSYTHPPACILHPDLEGGGRPDTIFGACSLAGRVVSFLITNSYFEKYCHCHLKKMRYFSHFSHTTHLLATHFTHQRNHNTTMFEARLTQGKVFKQLIEALKDLVQEANIDCSDDEMSIQAMDNSHVALVAVSLRSGGFDHFRCDRPISLGFNATNMGKILKCAGNDDIITLKAEDDGDSLALVFESPGQDRIADFGEFVFN